jgi:hypothetical protein
MRACILLHTCGNGRGWKAQSPLAFRSAIGVGPLTVGGEAAGDHDLGQPPTPCELALLLGGCGLLSLGSCAGPAFFTLSVAAVPAERQGEMQASSGFVMLAAACIGSVGYSAMFHVLPPSQAHLCAHPARPPAPAPAPVARVGWTDDVVWSSAGGLLLITPTDIGYHGLMADGCGRCFLLGGLVLAMAACALWSMEHHLEPASTVARRPTSTSSAGAGAGHDFVVAPRDSIAAEDVRGGGDPPPHSIFLDENRRYIGKSQSKPARGHQPAAAGLPPPPPRGVSVELPPSGGLGGSARAREGGSRPPVFPTGAAAPVLALLGWQQQRRGQLPPGSSVVNHRVHLPGC